jgi:phosphomannomutase / phosphoglucomutase
MTVDSTIFREYDIRGIVDLQLTEDAVRRIGDAYVRHARGQAKKVVVGRDCREHSERLLAALCEGLTGAGADVVDVGVLTTPMLYFAMATLGVDGGIQITGSHNPPEYNGLKIGLAGRPLFGDEIRALQTLVEAGPGGKASVPGERTRQNVQAEYEAYCLGQLKMGPRRLKVVIDAGNGTGGPFAVSLLKKLNVETIPLYCDMDATFPNHHPDPTVEENLIELQKEVRRSGSDVGLALDGDADRIGAVDEHGNILWGDQLMILFSRAVLQDVPGATIIADVKCSQTLYDDIRKHGGHAIMWKSGHSLIKDKMRQAGAALGGEMSGHIFFKHRFLGFDDGIFSGLRLLELLSNTHAPLSSLLADVPKMYSTAELRVDCPEEDKFRLVEMIQDHFRKTHEVIDIDGARVLFDGGWGLVRASNTQPLLVMRFEAGTPEKLTEIRLFVESAVELLKGQLR